MIDKERLEKGLFWQRALKLVEGCTKVSPGCDNCWSETETHMRRCHPNLKIQSRAVNVTNGFSSTPGQSGKFNGHILLREDNLDLPLRTKKPTVWSIWNDLYHEDVPLTFICDAIRTMDRSRKFGHKFLVLTKRAERMADFLSEVGEEIPDHVWHGVTVEDQQRADERIPHLLRVPGKRFLSIEPMLGAIDLHPFCKLCGDFQDYHCPGSNRCESGFRGIHAVLLGGESGKNARPMHPDWARSVRDQCAAAGVAFYFKQWGEWWPCFDSTGSKAVHEWPDGERVHRVGKKIAGRLLDGRTHDELPWDGAE